MSFSAEVDRFKSHGLSIIHEACDGEHDFMNIYGESILQGHPKKTAQANTELRNRLY